MTVGSIIVLAIVIALIAVAVFVLVRDHRSGKCACGCKDCCDCCGKAIKIDDKKE